MFIETPLAPPSDGHDDEAEPENWSIPELISALRAASRSDDIGRVEEAVAAREAKLKQEIEKQKHENALLEEIHEFERLEKLKAEDDLKQSMAEVAAVSENRNAANERFQKFLEEAKEKGKEVIWEFHRRNSELESRILRLEKGNEKSRKGENREIEDLQRRRSERLASIDDNDTNDNGNVKSVPGKKQNGGLQISGYSRVSKKQMGKNKLEKKKIGKQRYFRGEDYVQFRCNMMSFFNTMQRIKQHLTEGHLTLLQQTPFWPLVSAFYSGVISEDQCKKSEWDIIKIIKCFNSRTMRFEFGRTSASLTTEDIAEILGLPQEGEAVKLKGSRKYQSDFIKRYFDVKRVTKAMVDDALEEAIKGKRETDAKDAVRLIIIELCITFLLCNSGTTTSWNLVKYCEDLENISRYSWAKAVTDFLHKALKKQNKRPYSVAGCVVVITLWLCEKTNLIQPIKGREGQTPALVKWSLQELHLQLKNINAADIGLTFQRGKKKKKKKEKEENEKTHEEAKIDGREDREEENVFDDVTGSLEDEFRAEMTEMESLPTPTISERLKDDKEDLEKGSEDLWEMVQNASAEVAKAQGKVKRLTERLKSKKERTKKLKKKLKEEKEENRRLKEANEIVIAEKKSFFESVKKLVRKLEGTLEAEREEVKNLKKEKMALIKEKQELKDQLKQGSPCTVVQSREDIQIEVSPKRSCLTKHEESIIKRALDSEFETEQGGLKKRKIEDEEEEEDKKEDVQSDAIPAGIVDEVISVGEGFEQP